jgi:hypothetical protein
MAASLSLSLLCHTNGPVDVTVEPPPERLRAGRSGQVGSIDRFESVHSDARKNPRPVRVRGGWMLLGSRKQDSVSMLEFRGLRLTARTCDANHDGEAPCGSLAAPSGRRCWRAVPPRNSFDTAYGEGEEDEDEVGLRRCQQRQGPTLDVGRPRLNRSTSRQPIVLRRPGSAPDEATRFESIRRGGLRRRIPAASAPALLGSSAPALLGSSAPALLGSSTPALPGSSAPSCSASAPTASTSSRTGPTTVPAGPFGGPVRRVDRGERRKWTRTLDVEAGGAARTRMTTTTGTTEWKRGRGVDLLRTNACQADDFLSKGNLLRYHNIMLRV